MSAAVERRSLLAGGTRTRLVQAGPADASEAVAFVHGNPGSADDWERMVGAAGNAGMRAVAFDLPDFGETIAPDGFEHDPSGYAAFVGEALQELGIERVHLVIHDFGGPIGLIWAMAHPDAVASITLIDTGLMPGYRWHSTARVWRTPIAGEALQAIATRSLFRFLITVREPRGLPREFVE
jgi:pimeloyl-ACP methyl ester carboxylesterase